jgi:hypothetical protein
MKILKLAFFFLIVTFVAKADDLKNSTVSTLLEDNFVITDKFMPEPFDGFIYFVLKKEKNLIYKQISVEELYNIVENKKNYQLSLKNKDSSLNVSDTRINLMNDKNLIVVICQVSFEKTNCRKP